MIKVHIDFSIFTKEAAFGMISGSLTLPVAPQIGDAIAFRISKKVEAYLGQLPFGGYLRVTRRLIGADADLGILLTLEDVTAATSDDAQRLVSALEESYGLFGDVWENQ
ncbi:MAG TPA: hypothetical protein VK533_01025 [Sphingomonas sp.]|uniref:hypothetical protein n=1 Tax=Sphingomonas sp. TaxID=28214 RepID=UPI002C283431|nr:hypothetical protein [Sphingomonas sp.]HMI18102.1 hypothetical protein [Sphingomonas sp.]